MNFRQVEAADANLYTLSGFETRENPKVHSKNWFMIKTL
jgi:hypothetical protein